MIRYPICLLLLIVVSCQSVYAQMVDTAATRETKALYHNLKKLLPKGKLFGHQDDLAYGVNWKYQPGRSDIKEVCGQYPGVFGWELGRLEVDAPVNLDSVPFDKMKAYIRDRYAAGAVVTISWHLNNPLTGLSAWDPSPPTTIPSILPGGSAHSVYNSWLDKVALFFGDLKGKKGEPIPVIFRPFHELNGNWFWWGGKNCTPEAFKQLWRYTINYLRDVKGLHQLLYAFNTDRFADEKEYLERYPGDEWVDIVGFDIYQKGDILSNKAFIKELDRSLSLLEKIAAAHSKIPALTEFGYNMVPDSTWWTQVFAKAIRNHQIAFVLAWRNAGRKSASEVEYYAPYRGQRSAADFLKFSKSSSVYFENRTSMLHLYR